MTREQLATALADDWEDVEGQWLAAGKSADVLRMRELQRRHPQRLALDRVFEDEDGDTRQQSQARVSDWSGFPLATLGASAIHAAAWNRSLDVIRFLLESGQHPDARDDWQMTPLMATIMRHGLPLIRSVFVGREAIPRHLVMDLRKENDERTAVTLEIVRLLLLHGADIDARNHDGKTALIVAAHDNTFEIAEMLLDCGAALDLHDQRGWTALRHSVEGRGLFTTNMLIARGADIDFPDASGVSPLRAAIQKRLVNQLQLFINYYALSVRKSRLDFVGFVLLEAVDSDSYDVVQQLLREGAFVSIHFRNERGETAFHCAQSIRMVELLLEFDPGFSVFCSRTQKREYCFHFAARKSGDNSQRVLTALLDVLDSGRLQSIGTGPDGLDLLGADVEGVTPLFVAATNPNDFREVRAAKCSALMNCNAPLFPSGHKLWVQHFDRKYSETVVALSDRVQECLRCWLLDTHDNDSDGTAASQESRDLETLVSRWVALVDFGHMQHQDSKLQSKKSPLSGEVLLLLVFTGFSRELLPLVLSLPLGHRAASKLLGFLAGFANHRQQDRMAFLRRLVVDMSEALDLAAAASR